jgi:hypothetical protein
MAKTRKLPPPRVPANSRDLAALNKENTALMDERDKLRRELDYLSEYCDLLRKISTFVAGALQAAGRLPADRAVSSFTPGEIHDEMTRSG